MKRLYNICSYCLKKERKYTLRPHCWLQPTYESSPIEHGPRLYGTLAFTIQDPRQEDVHINLPKQPHPSSLNPPQNMSLLWNLCAKQSWKCSSGSYERANGSVWSWLSFKRFTEARKWGKSLPSLDSALTNLLNIYGEGNMS